MNAYQKLKTISLQWIFNIVWCGLSTIDSRNNVGRHYW